jgi:hypothetical protein
MKREDRSSFSYQSTDVCNQLHAPVSLTARKEQRYPSDSTVLVSLRVGICRESNCSRPDRNQITSPESFLFVLTESKMEIPSSGFYKYTRGASFLTRGTGRNNHHTWRYNYMASHRENGIFNSTPPESESVQSTVEIPLAALLQDTCMSRDLTAPQFHYFFFYHWKNAK